MAVIKPPFKPSLAMAFGVLDGAVGLSYAFHMGVDLWYGIVISIKIISLILINKSKSRPTRLELITLSYLVLMGFATLFSGDHPIIESYIALGAFVVSLGATLWAIEQETASDYFNAVFWSVVLTAALHIGNVKLGHEKDNFGRFYFFDRTPNLGGENAAIASVVGLIGVQKRWWYLVGASILVADLLLLDSRSALITVVPAVVVAVSFSTSGKLRFRALATSLVIAMLASPLIFLGVTSHGTTSAISDVMAFDSVDRGAGTGFSGRSDIWSTAIEFFNSSPLVGHSLGHFAELGYPGAHNFVLFGLAQYGLMFLGVLGVIGFLYLKIAQRGVYLLVTVACATPLLLFNDRLVNLNAYPFVFYVLVFVLGQPYRGQLGRIIRHAPRRPQSLRRATA